MQINEIKIEEISASYINVVEFPIAIHWDKNRNEIHL